MSDGIRRDIVVRLYLAKKPAANRADVRNELSVPEARMLVGAQNQVHPLRLTCLECCHSLVVVRELKHVRRLGVTRKLRVLRLVAPGSECGRSVHLNEKIGPAAPIVCSEHALVNDVSASEHGQPRRFCGLCPPRCLSWIRDSCDVSAFTFELLQVQTLVGLALRGEQAGLRFAVLR